MAELKKIQLKDVKENMRVLIEWNDNDRRFRTGSYYIMKKDNILYAISEAYIRNGKISSMYEFNTLYTLKNRIDSKRVKNIYEKIFFKNYQRGSSSRTFDLRGEKLMDYAFKNKSYTNKDISYLLVMGYESNNIVLKPSINTKTFSIEHKNKIYL